ncbi:transporter substrate-binding domain-containing protein [Vibrio aquaticus]|uniref:Transporter substrate-binding domain-containing protein n=1 Tax=Vibrio aquaticus TaxID=2496559 RepID=A0A3S0PNL8_9VIBR|nr:transporter substrate-binding domain-containing protein [Vibrio aquaticus]RTZ15622.1 transporter substrate-binding domain-containing protein [Vibrio aquaticus]
MKHILCFVSYCFLSLSFQASAKNVDATQAVWPPYVFDSVNSGLAIEIVQEAYATQGYDLTMEIKPWLRSLKEVRNKQKDVLVSIWWSDDRTEKLDFSVPYLLVQLKFVVLKENAFEYKDFTSLSGMKVGVIEDYGYGEAFNQSDAFTRIVAEDLETNVRKLRAKRIDAIIADERATLHTMKQLGLDIQDFYFVDKSLMIKPVHLAVAKDHPDKQKLMVKFMIGLHTLKQNGRYDALLEKYR